MCIFIYGFKPELMKIFLDKDFGTTDISSIIRNLILSLGALIGFPLIVWRAEISDRSQKIAEKTAVTDLYIKAIEQLSSDKETIRTAGTHALIQLLEQAINKQDHTTKQHIWDILWCFMQEHSRDVWARYKFNDQESQEECVNQMQPYYPQFRMIIQALPKKDNRHWWQTRYWPDIFLEKIDLRYADLKDAYLVGINLKSANLGHTNLENAALHSAILERVILEGVDLRNAELILTKLQSAFLIQADLRDVSLKFTDFNEARYDKYTIFSEDFNPKEHGMIKV